MPDNIAAMAANLIGTRHLPAGLAEVRARAREAWAYHKLSPYPQHHFTDWRVEDRGPLPRCMPIARSIVRRGARWLFGRGLTLSCPGNEALEEFLRDAWRANRMRSRLKARAEVGALEGGIVLKLAYDDQGPVPLSIQTLSAVEQVRLYYHPHDRDRLLMARVQYPYYDAQTGERMWHREEWTDALQVTYTPIRDGVLTEARKDADNWEGWEVADGGRVPNRMGEIPLLHVRNIDLDDVWGEGDLWECYRVLDRIHLSYHLMDRSNQFDSEQNPIYIDADLEDDFDKPLQPGQPVALESAEGHQAKVQFPPTGNALRPAMMEYARDLRKQVLTAASSSEIDTAEVTNRGNLTQAVLTQLYAPQIEATEEKRVSYGENGIVPFLELAARCLSRLGVPDLGVTDDPESYRVEIQWPAYFELAEEELTARTGRIQEQEIQGYVTHSRAVREIAEAEGRDPDAVEAELEEEPPPEPDPVETDPKAADKQMREEMERSAEE